MKSPERRFSTVPAHVQIFSRPARRNWHRQGTSTLHLREGAAVPGLRQEEDSDFRQTCVCWDDLEFKQFSTPEGLPNSMVHQVYQDRDGYIWIPTSMDCFVMMVTRYVPINQIFIPLVFWLIIMCFVWKKIILTLGFDWDSRGTLYA